MDEARVWARVGAKVQMEGSGRQFGARLWSEGFGAKKQATSADASLEARRIAIACKGMLTALYGQISMGHAVFLFYCILWKNICH
jgi:hypothetical protein